MTDSSFIVLCSGALILMPVIYFILWIINKLGKGHSAFSWYKERFGITFIVVFFPIIAYACSITTGDTDKARSSTSCLLRCDS